MSQPSSTIEPEKIQVGCVAEPPVPQPPPAPRKTSTAGSVIANWIWFVFVTISGFITPRLLSDHLGKELLGVWDLGWAFVLYVSWLHLGVNASVVRYVARFRALEDWKELNATINSSLLLLLLGCALGIALSGAFAYFIPLMLPDADASTIRAGRFVVFFLCTSASFQLPGSAFNAIITGYERFDLLNAIRITRDVAVLTGNIILLASGFGVAACALSTLICEFCGELAKAFVARRLCPQMRIHPTHANWKSLRTMISYGGKTVAQGLANGSVYQLNSMIVSAMLGPTVLAVYSRQRALVLHSLRFMKQYAQVFIPRSSALDADGDHQSLKNLLILSSRYGLYIALPVIVLLIVMGGPLLQLWMGAGFEAPAILTVLALGHLLMIPQQGVYSILMGMNRHGRIAIYDIICAIVSISLSWVLIGPAGMGMMGAAIGIAAPLGVFSGVIMPIYACRLLKISIWHYFREIAVGPLLMVIPFAIILVVSRLLLQSNPLTALIIGSGVGGLVTAAIYWRWVVPAQMKQTIMKRILGRFGWFAPASNPAQA